MDSLFHRVFSYFLEYKTKKLFFIYYEIIKKLIGIYFISKNK